MTVGQTIKLTLAAVLAFVALFFIAKSATTVDQTERGILVTFGEVQEVLEPGLHFVNPFTSDVYKFDVTVQALQVNELAYSKDSQIVGAQATVNYRVDVTQIAKVWEDVRRDGETRYVAPRSNEAIKNVLAKYTAQEIIENRETLSSTYKENLVPRLDGTGFIIEDVALENLDFDDAYERAVTNKQVQEQEALTQANITSQEEEKKKQAILQAEALAEKTRLEVEALSLGGDEIIEKILAEAQLEAAKKWNGGVPSTLIMGGGADAANTPVVPFINVGR